jgi:hypothetical protein
MAGKSCCHRRDGTVAPLLCHSDHELVEPWIDWIQQHCSLRPYICSSFGHSNTHASLSWLCYTLFSNTKWLSCYPATWKFVLASPSLPNR